MGMSAGSSGGVASDINVTPLIDVLLVLLIIFMVIVPTTPKGLEALVPQPPKPNAPPPPENDRTIVVQVESGGALPVYKINDQQFPKSDIEPDLNFGSVAEVIGFGHQADVTNIGIITPQVEAGH